MKRLKSYKLFESVLWSKSIIEDLLLDITENGVPIYVNTGTWYLLDKKPLDWVRVDLGGFDFDGELSNKFCLRDCVIDLVEYMEDCGLVLMDTSWMWSDGWQHYIGCPHCLSDDIEDNYNLTNKTLCNKCGYLAPADSFLLDQWPVSVDIIRKVISKGDELRQLQLIFSDRRSMFGGG